MIWSLESDGDTYQKNAEIGQCIDKVSLTLPSKFSELSLPTSHSRTRPVFCRPIFYSLLYEITSLFKSDLKFLVSISDVDIDDPVIFCEIITIR